MTGGNVTEWENEISSSQKLSIENRALSNEETEALINLLEKHSQKLSELSFVKVSILELDLNNFLAAVGLTQHNLIKISLISIQSHVSSKTLHILKEVLENQHRLKELDLSQNNFLASGFGSVMAALKRFDVPVKLTLNNVPFNEEDQTNFMSGIEKGLKLSALNVEGSSLNSDRLNSMLWSSAGRKSHIEKSSVRGGPKKKFLLDFSTEEKANAVPQFLIKCECERKLPFNSIFSCSGCKKSHCKYCAKSTIYCYNCLYCMKSNLPQAASVRSRMRNVCSNCLQCPSCFNMLNTQEKKAGKASFYCNNCFWNSKNYGTECSNNEELITNNYSTTNSALKNVESAMRAFQESQNLITSRRNENPLFKGFQNELMKATEQPATRQTTELKDLTDPYWTYQLPSNPVAPRFRLFQKDTEDSNEATVPEHLDNPLFVKFYQPDKEGMTKMDYIDKFKLNEFNSKLFALFPVKVFYQKTDVLIPKRKLNAYVRKNCRTCLHSFLNFEIHVDSVIPKNTAYYTETSPLFDLQDLKFLREKDGAKVYRFTFRVLNFAAYKFRLEIEAGQNCELSEGEKKVALEFDFSVDAAFDINPLKISAAAVSARKQSHFSVDFTVQPNSPKVFFSLKITKGVVIQNESVSTDELFVDFKSPERFQEYLDALQAIYNL